MVSHQCVTLATSNGQVLQNFQATNSFPSFSSDMVTYCHAPLAIFLRFDFALVSCLDSFPIKKSCKPVCLSGLQAAASSFGKSTSSSESGSVSGYRSLELLLDVPLGDELWDGESSAAGWRLPGIFERPRLNDRCIVSLGERVSGSRE